MSALVLVALGPIQLFIKSSRRSRDFWFGSHLLSELARAAARALAEHGRLVFPALERGGEELKPTLRMLREDGRVPLAVANKVLAEVEDGPGAAKAAREAALTRWKEIAAIARSDAGGLVRRGPEDDLAWEEQLDSVLELYAAWEPLAGDYAAARARLEGRVAARKGLRDFAQLTRAVGPQTNGLPKSSLDGERETVIVEPKRRPKDLVRRYKVSDGEQLDAIGVIKRCGGKPDAFVPLANVAARPWLVYARKVAGEELRAFEAAMKQAGVVRARQSIDDDLEFDVEPMWEGRLRPFAEENKLVEGGQLNAAAEAIKSCVGKLTLKAGQPTPYIAAVFADGDRMGATLDHLTSADAQRAFSTKLAGFAGDARRIVEDHQGELLYAGGDDVMGFVPVQQAIACADALRRRFDELRLPEDRHGRRPTLSVGVAIAHVLGGMQDLLEVARTAEAAAKAKHLKEHLLRGDALAVVLDKRSGGTFTWRATWKEDPRAQLERDVALLASGRLSQKKPYEVEAAAHRLPERSDDPRVLEAGSGLISMILARTNRGEDTSGLKPDEVGLDLQAADWTTLRARVLAWSARLRIARAILNVDPGRSR